MKNLKLSWNYPSKNLDIFPARQHLASILYSLHLSCSFLASCRSGRPGTACGCKGIRGVTINLAVDAAKCRQGEWLSSEQKAWTYGVDFCRGSSAATAAHDRLSWDDRSRRWESVSENLPCRQVDLNRPFVVFRCWPDTPQRSVDSAPAKHHHACIRWIYADSYDCDTTRTF